jgi:hypothetical protein
LKDKRFLGPDRAWGVATVRRILIWLLAAAAILAGVLALWVYQPRSDRQSRRIAADLFKYRRQFANQDYLSIGLTPVLPDSLWELCPKDRSPSCHTDINSASMIYCQTRFGIYSER